MHRQPRLPDDGTGGGTYNNGIMDGTESGVANVRVELWHDVDGNGAPDGAMVAFDTTVRTAITCSTTWRKAIMSS